MRRRVTHAYIANKTERKASYKKRKVGLIKKMKDLTTLCGVQAFAIIYSPYDDGPVFWPSTNEIQGVINRFNGLSSAERAKKMVDQESFTRHRVKKAEDSLLRLQKVNKRNNLDLFMHKYLAGEASLLQLEVRDGLEMILVVNNTVKKLDKKIEIIDKSREQQRNPAADSQSGGGTEAGLQLGFSYAWPLMAAAAAGCSTSAPSTLMDAGGFNQDFYANLLLQPPQVVAGSASGSQMGAGHEQESMAGAAFENLLEMEPTEGSALENCLEMEPVEASASGSLMGGGHEQESMAGSALENWLEMDPAEGSASGSLMGGGHEEESMAASALEYWFEMEPAEGSASGSLMGGGHEQESMAASALENWFEMEPVEGSASGSLMGGGHEQESMAASALENWLAMEPAEGSATGSLMGGGHEQEATARAASETGDILDFTDLFLTPYFSVDGSGTEGGYQEDLSYLPPPPPPPPPQGVAPPQLPTLVDTFPWNFIWDDMMLLPPSTNAHFSGDEDLPSSNPQGGEDKTN